MVYGRSPELHGDTIWNTLVFTHDDQEVRMDGWALETPAMARCR
jgi:hypothetical protein